MQTTPTATTVAHTTPEKAWLDQAFAPASITFLLGLVVAVISIWSFLRKVKRENDEGARERAQEIKDEFKAANMSIGERVTKIEGKILDFMPRAEIVTAIEHEKANRQSADQGLKDITDRLTIDVRAIMISQGKLEQQQTGFANDMSEIKTLVKDLGRDMNAKLDKLQDGRPRA